jgi:hypothetical protein
MTYQDPFEDEEVTTCRVLEMASDAPVVRPRDLTQRYGEPEEIFHDRVQISNASDALRRRLDRAESLRAATLDDSAEVLGL